ncbi:hypothetical protein [Lactiplantibacillus plantarum]|nr:hypothetical protein [Lactiplantibacillus plantarum]
MECLLSGYRYWCQPAGKATKSQIIQGIGNYKRYLEVKGIQDSTFSS